MRILIDASQIPKLKSGVGMYAVHLIRSLALFVPDHDYFVLVQSDENAFDDLPGRAIKRIKVPGRIYRLLPFRFVLEQAWIPYFVRRYRIDLVHSLHYSFPLFATAASRVVTIHDLTFFIGPHWHLPIKRWYFGTFTRLAVSHADRLIAVSESTANDLKDRMGVDPKKLTVVHLAPPEAPPEHSVVDTLLRHYGIGERYILFVGTLEPRKNLFNLVRAFHRICPEESDLQLVIAGRKGWGCKSLYNLVQELDLQRRVVFTGYVDEAAKFKLIRRAKVFAYPSLYEGFGIPVLEALSLGIPTITADRPALREVAGEAVLFVDPESPEAISSAMLRLLRDERLRRELSLKGLQRAKHFSWTCTAIKTGAVYRSLMGNGKQLNGRMRCAS
ncbi:MAG: glycosyltransferase family 1 protein [Desulfobacterales bacterium]